MPIPADNQPPVEDKLEEGLKADLQPKTEKPEGEQPETEQKVPYHQDPNVQLYIERQVAKRVGEGSQAWEDRIAKLETKLQEAKSTDEPAKIGNWTPATKEEARAAKAIVEAAKQELLDELSTRDRQAQEQTAKADEAFGDWLKELEVTGTLKGKEDQEAFAKLIVDYGIDDKQKAINLWNRLQTDTTKAKEDGEVAGIKKAQEAKIGSGRKGNEPGVKGRSFTQRRAEEPNFDAILDRELTRLTNN